MPKASAKADGGKDSDSNREEDTGYDSEECGGELEEYERQPRGKQVAYERKYSASVSWHILIDLVSDRTFFLLLVLLDWHIYSYFSHFNAFP